MGLLEEGDGSHLHPLFCEGYISNHVLCYFFMHNCNWIWVIDNNENNIGNSSRRAVKSGSFSDFSLYYYSRERETINENSPYLNKLYLSVYKLGVDNILTILENLNNHFCSNFYP